MTDAAALAYGLFALVNISWPRTPEAPWYDDHVVLLGAGIVVGAGLLYMFTTHHYGRSTAPAGVAVPSDPRGDAAPPPTPSPGERP